MRTDITDLIHLVYVSSAIRGFSRTDLLSLLEKSRHNNQRAGVTGLLLYRDGNIMQLLEGPAQVVAATFARISKDPRHVGVVALLREPISRRAFADFSMGFRDLTGSAVRHLPGYNEFLNRDARTIENTPNHALRLLLLFRKNMR